MKKTKTFSTKKNLMILLIVIIALGAYFVISAIFTSKKTNEVLPIENTSIKNTVEGEITLEIVGPEEEPGDEERAYAPGEITNIFEDNSTTYFTVDMLTINPEFKPGITDYFINQNLKLRDLAISKKTKAFTCSTENIPDVSVPVETLIMNIQNMLSGSQSPVIYFFDIDDNKINTIYEQCLP